MTETTTAQPEARDYSDTLYLPKTDFPMRAGLPKKEPELLARWSEMGLYRRLRETSKGRTQFVLHDGPPYANGNLHIGHALNKILKDVVTRSHQMLGYDSNYVPGWDCHGLPIEWKIEETYRAKGLDKDKVPVIEFRQECRQFAEHWVGVQTEEFRRFGVEGDFAQPYLTMSFDAEAQIARELMKFATSGQLYRGSKPVMWSVVEKTALAEAEVEYAEHQSDTIWVKFPVRTAQAQENVINIFHDPEHASEENENAGSLADAFVLIWTTTPWTIPGNRAISYSDRIAYGLYRVTSAENDFGPQAGEKLILADALAGECFEKAKLGFERLRDVGADELSPLTCWHPLKGLGGGYEFAVPLLPGDHVTDDAGTGFVHTAPGHGTDDFEVWMDHRRDLEARGIDTTIPYTVEGDGTYTREAPGFEGKAVITSEGKTGDANKAVIEALIAAERLFARGRLKHQYPHSWRSKKPVIFRNTPQWFVHMDRDLGGYGLPEGTSPAGEDTLRSRALAAIDQTRFVPAAGKNRLRGMIENRPDWVLSRQRAWGVPICVFRHEDGRLAPGPEFSHSQTLVGRIAEAFEAEGADAWFAEDAKARFLGDLVNDLDRWQQVTDILDVWFDSGSTHAFVLEKRPDLKWPADVYLEGSDQHRGWFHSSLLESCGTRGRAPYDTVITHGFTMAEDGRKMSKSLGNNVAPQDIIAQSGADILRLWVMTCDYADDQRIGKEILKGTSDTYRKLRNTIRWMLGTLAHADGATVALTDMPELERLMLHRLVELDRLVRQGYRDYDYKKVAHALVNFATVDLSAFYFDIRKDALYCDPASSTRRKAALQVIDIIFEALTRWLAPMLPFTMEESHLARHGDEADRSIHLELFPEIDPTWEIPQLAEKWAKVREVRRVVLGAIEVERREKRIRGSLEAHVTVHVTNPALYQAVADVDLADVSITSQATLTHEEAPAEAFRLDDTPGVAVIVTHAEGQRCARSWKVLPEVGSDPDYPDLSLRDAEAMREFEAKSGHA
ncbi:isoleucine--tRNA ligase [Amorphus orientalis]|uniref:Isoleucine--tRNA ligase n=1 Tax=Amorphus orientalis TaxID=649198 RepID=A0AAE3VP07_9HYPH|nr:isoleucine--tRNA ligase [Amorphus orientalis]MDQ0316164.1 isoleucyl-tRNA synthetase [Amorphus orientalis]